MNTLIEQVLAQLQGFVSQEALQEIEASLTAYLQEGETLPRIPISPIQQPEQDFLLQPEQDLLLQQQKQKQFLASQGKQMGPGTVTAASRPPPLAPSGNPGSPLIPQPTPPSGWPGRDTRRDRRSRRRFGGNAKRAQRAFKGIRSGGLFGGGSGGGLFG
jgi:hypothetical protein